MGGDRELSTHDRSRRVLLGVLISAMAVGVALVVATVTGVPPAEIATAGRDVDAVSAIDEPSRDPGYGPATTISPGPSTTASPERNQSISTVPGPSVTSGEGEGTTTTTTVCANSFAPDCGPFRWTVARTNQPMTVTMEVLTEDPVGGEFVFVRLSAIDPDATPIAIAAEWVPLESGYAPSSGNCYHHGVDEGFGPWSPPAPRPGTLERVERLVAPDEGGTWWIRGCFSSTAWEYNAALGSAHTSAWCPGDPSSWAFEGYTCRDPYGDFATPVIAVEIAPRPAP